MSEIEAPPIGTVMLIDDEEVDQMLYSRIVERSKHADTILSFLDAEKALTYLVSDEKPRPDLVLLDINMPRMDGFEFLDHLVEHMGKDVAPMIILLTTSFDPQDRARAEACDMVHGFCRKPLTEAKLGEFRADVARAAASTA